MRRRLLLGGFKIPIVFLFAAVLVILPIGIAFGQSEPEPTGRNLAAEADPLVEIYDIGFHTGSPGNDTEKFPNLTYPDGVRISSGDFWLSFAWRLKDPAGAVAYGDYFDVVLDLGLSQIAAEVKQQVGTFAPIIYLSDGTAAGTIKWINEHSYQDQQRIVIRIHLDAAGFDGLTGDDTEEGRVAGTAVWGFRYKAGSGATGERPVSWQVSAGESGIPGGQITVTPEPPGGTETPGGGNKKYNPYEEYEPGYDKIGTRLTQDDTPLADNIFYWNVTINGHKHATYEEWANCPNNKDANPYNDDPPLPTDENGNFTETFTITDTGQYIAPTWLRDVTEEGGKPVLHADTPLTVARGQGLYGQSADGTQGPAYFKLFYVNSAYIWQDRIDYAGSGYGTPANDGNPNHKPTEAHPVGPYDPYYSTWYLDEGEVSSVLYAPHGSETGGKYAGYLEPVPTADVKSIRLTQNGFEIEMYTEKVLGKTLSIAYMTRPATDAEGLYHGNVGNTVAIVGVNDGGSITGASGEALIGGTITGTQPLRSPNRGKLVIEKRDLNTALPMQDVAFDVVASSEDMALASAANEKIEAQRAASTLPGTLLTDQNGKLTIDLPALPWTGGKNLTLTITETAPASYVGVQPFTIVLEPKNGTVISYTPGQGDGRFVQLTPDQYGVYVWNKSTVGDKGYYDAALRKWIKKVDRTVSGQVYNVYYNNEPNTDIVSVKNGDRVLFRVDVYNQCLNNIIIPEITDYLPVGFTFDPAATVGNIDPSVADYTNDLWTLVPGTDGAADVLKYTGAPIWLRAWDGQANGYPEARIPLILTVNVSADVADGTVLTNIAEISRLQDENGKDVEDIDSTPDSDRDNDGDVPGVDYGAAPPDGIAKDNEIEEHRKGEDGGTDLTQDEDDHDYASVRVSNPIAVSCEVDKDTIRRTSAAYVSLPGHEGFDNVGDESYRYDINFRSTSSLPADEFTVDDPLENVGYDQVRIESLWTPVVWGDEDGKYNIWYKTNLTDDKKNYSNVKATEAGVTQRWPNTGFKLWKQGLDTTVRQRLDVSDLGLNASRDEHITALRFEYGAVKVGFTSKNYSSISLNGVHRTAVGGLALSAEDLARVASQSAGMQTSAGEPAGGASVSALALSPSVVDDGQPTALDTGGVDIVDWTPSPARDDYAEGALKAQGLLPVSYLVTATRAMQNENIVSSAEAHIAKQELWDADVDAVLTRELVTFTLGDAADEEPLIQSTFEDNIPRKTPNTEKATTGSQSARTFDEMKPYLWICLAIASVCVALFLWFGRERQTRPVAESGPGFGFGLKRKRGRRSGNSERRRTK